MASLFVVEELFEQTKEQMVALGSELDHAFGAKFRGRHGLPNRYVWVPTKTREAKKGTMRGGANERALYDIEEAFEVECWGESHQVAITMRNDLVHAMKLAIGTTAPLRFDDCEWEEEDEDETTNGNILLARFAIASVIPDRFVGVGRFVRRTPQVPVAPTVPTTQPTSAEIRTYSSPNTSTDGELVAEDTVEP